MLGIWKNKNLIINWIKSKKLSRFLDLATTYTYFLCDFYR